MFQLRPWGGRGCGVGLGREQSANSAGLGTSMFRSARTCRRLSIVRAGDKTIGYSKRPRPRESLPPQAQAAVGAGCGLSIFAEYGLLAFGGLVYAVAGPLL